MNLKSVIKVIKRMNNMLIQNKLYDYMPGRDPAVVFS